MPFNFWVIGDSLEFEVGIYDSEVAIAAFLSPEFFPEREI